MESMRAPAQPPVLARVSRAAGRRAARAAAAAALVVAAAVAPGTAAAQEEVTLASVMETLQRMAVQYGVLMVRSFVDVTYETIAVEPGTGDVVITGLRLFPQLDWDPEGGCEIAVDRLAVADATGLDRLGSSIALDGLRLPPACFRPEIGETLAGFGYDGMTVENAAIDIDYHLPSSSADLVVQAAVADAAEIGLSAHFDYLWVRLPVTDAGDPETAAAEAEHVARLGRAELAIENRGLWEALEPMLTEQLGDVSAIPEIVQMMLSSALSQGGTRAVSPQESAFIGATAEEVARFVRNRDRIVLTVAPGEGSVLLTEELMSSPARLIAALDPVVSSVPAAVRDMVAPDELAAALSGADGLDDATRLRVGEALVTGTGAPRAVEAGRALLAPLAERWNGRAALLAAQADRAAGDAASAYAMALRAMAAGETAAIGLADALEAELPLGDVLSAQAAASGAWPKADEAGAQADAVVAAGDLAGMRRRAQAAAIGRDRPRDYADAYYWASLAAAGGDRVAAALRDRLDARFAGDTAWRETASARQDRALDTWTGGLAATVAARAR